MFNFLILTYKYTKSSGMIGYFEICQLMNEGNWKRIWDYAEKVPFIHNAQEWVGYEDSNSLIEKVFNF